MAEPTPPVARATLSQVAQRAQVSLKTASRALGGEKYVSDETRERVFAAASELGYQRNAAASLLASGRFADDVSFIAGELSNPFYAMIATGLENALWERTMHLSVASSHESRDHEWHLAQSLADVHTKALVVASALPEHSRYAELQNRGIPVVFVDRPAVGLQADSVVLDNVAGGRTAATHLLDHGHRDIAFIGDHDWLPTHRDRIAGMGQVLEDQGLTDWKRLVRTGTSTATAAKERAHELMELPHPPTAIIAGNNRITLGISEALADRDDARPAVVGFDDFEWASVLGITVIANDASVMGTEAARLALARLGSRPRATETVVLPMQLIARGSGETPPSR